MRSQNVNTSRQVKRAEKTSQIVEMSVIKLYKNGVEVEGKQNPSGSEGIDGVREFYYFRAGEVLVSS